MDAFYPHVYVINLVEINDRYCGKFRVKRTKKLNMIQRNNKLDNVWLNNGVGMGKFCKVCCSGSHDENTTNQYIITSKR